MNKTKQEGISKTYVFIKCALVTKRSKMYTVFLSHVLLISLGFNVIDAPLNRPALPTLAKVQTSVEQFPFVG